MRSYFDQEVGDYVNSDFGLADPEPLTLSITRAVRDAVCFLVVAGVIAGVLLAGKVL